MKSTVRFIRKNLLTFFLALLILFMINLMLFTYWGYWAAKIDDSIINPNILGRELTSQINQNGVSVVIDEKSLETLEKNQIWAMLIDNNTGNVIWSKDLPEDIPSNYSRRDIALFTRYYLRDYPVFTYVNDKGLLVLGYPKDSYARIPTNAFPLALLRNLPLHVLYFLLFNLVIVFIIYMVSKRKLLRSINPITDAILKISKGEKMQLEEKGDLFDIKAAVNETSRQLKERDSMRVNWIAGISHDIRTPLSLIMGYADHLLQSKHPDETERKELELIRSNSMQIQDLVSNLNLTSRLEYNLVPMETKSIPIVKVLREIIVDYINHDTQNRYDFNFISATISSSTVIYGDEKLLGRAFRNIILNSMKHNPEGCKIQIEIGINNNDLTICISNDGIGVSEDLLASLNVSASETIKKNNSAEKSHGLGLLIVKQIIELHQGSVVFNSFDKQGFNTIITLSLMNH